MEVAKAIRPLHWNCHPNHQQICRTWSRRCRDNVAVPVRRPTNSDFLAECARAENARPLRMSITRRATAVSPTWYECGVLNQTDEVELMRRRLEPAADRVQGKQKYAIEHGFENAIEEPRRYNDFSARTNTRYSASQSRAPT